MKAITILVFVILFTSISTKAQWAPLNSGTSRSLNAVDFPSLNVGYVLPFMGPLLRTIDGGNTWDSLTTIWLAGSGLFDNDVSFVNDSVGFISTHDTSTGYLKIFKTTDSGNVWTDITPFNVLYGRLQVQFLNDQVGYMYSNSAFDDSLWITTNGGTSWIKRILGFSLGSGTSSMPAMSFVNDTTGYLAGGDGSFAYMGVIQRTSDAGQSWTTTILPSSYTLITAIHFPNKDTGYVATRYGDIYRTINEGSTWDSIATLNLGTYTQVFFLDGATGFVISGMDIYKTTDAGISWTINYTGSAYLSSIDFADDSTGYVVGDNGTILKTINIGTVGIAEALYTEAIDVYPCPAHDKLFVQNHSDQSFQFTLYNSSGAKVIDKMVKDKSVLDLYGAKGIYFYRCCRDNNDLRTGKIIVE